LYPDQNLRVLEFLASRKKIRKKNKKQEREREREGERERERERERKSAMMLPTRADIF